MCSSRPQSDCSQTVVLVHGTFSPPDNRQIMSLKETYNLNLATVIAYRKSCLELSDVWWVVIEKASWVKSTGLSQQYVPIDAKMRF